MRSSRDALQDTHDDYRARVAFSSLKKCCYMGGMLWRNMQGHVITLKPHIIMDIGDTSEHKELCGHYISNVAKCLSKDCKWQCGDLIDEPLCKPMRWK
jgi:hypothetical protein